jgi:hypothetical protein
MNLGKDEDHTETSVPEENTTLSYQWACKHCFEQGLIVLRSCTSEHDWLDVEIGDGNVGVLYAPSLPCVLCDEVSNLLIKL